MALGQAATFACATSTLRILSFILGIIAENKKPAAGTATTEGYLTVCSYPGDHYIALGVLSMTLLSITSVVGVASIFFSYKNVTVPLAALARSKLLLVFGIISSILFLVAEGLMMWAVIIEHNHHVNHTHLLPKCPTAKTGLMGGAAFLALDTTLFWLVCQMLTMNAREDHLSIYESDEKGSYGEVVSEEYGAATAHPISKA